MMILYYIKVCSTIDNVFAPKCVKNAEIYYDIQVRFLKRLQIM